MAPAAQEPQGLVRVAQEAVLQEPGLAARKPELGPVRAFQEQALELELPGLELAPQPVWQEPEPEEQQVRARLEQALASQVQVSIPWPGPEQPGSQASALQMLG